MKKLFLILGLFIVIICDGQYFIDKTVASMSTNEAPALSQNYIVEANNGSLYVFYNNWANYDFYYVKSTDRGKTWNSPVLLKATTGTCIAVWYDRWTDPSGALGDLIHLAYG